MILPDIATEDRLLARARQGDENALRLIYQQYFGAVYQYVRLRVASQDEADDIASDVFFKMVKAFRGQNAPRHSLRGWLFKLARNGLYDLYGRRQRFESVELEDWIPDTDDMEPELQFMREMEAGRVRQAMSQLTMEQQEVLILRFGQMLDLQETADVMDKNVNAVKALQLRALNSLRRILETSHHDN